MGSPFGLTAPAYLSALCLQYGGELQLAAAGQSFLVREGNRHSVSRDLLLMSR
jgi:hypothetical protein